MPRDSLRNILSPIRRVHWSNPFFLGFLAVFLILGTSVYVKISDQQEYLIKRNFRLLAMWSNNLTEAIGNYEKVFQSALSVDFPDVDAIPRTVRGYLEGVEGLSAIWVEVLDSTERVSEGLSVVPGEKSQGDRLELEYIGYPNPQKRKRAVRITASLYISEMLGRIMTRNVFQDVLVFDGHGEAVFQHNPSEMRFRRLTHLLAYTGSNESPLLGLFDGEDGASGDESKPAFMLGESRIAVPALIDVHPGGHELKLFAQAVFLPGSAASEKRRAELMLAGLVPQDVFQKEYLEISYPLLLFLGFALLAGLLCLPLLRLGFSAPGARMKVVDVLSIFFSVLMLTGLFVVVLSDSYSYVSLSYEMDHNLRRGAESIAGHLEQEITATIDFLTRIDTAFANNQGDYGQAGNQLKDHCSKVGLIRDVIEETGYDLGKIVYAFWVYPNGEMRHHCAGPDNAVVDGVVPLSERPYVQAIQQERGWRAPGIDREFYVQPIRSWNTAESSTVLSIPSVLSGTGEKPGIPIVAALEIKRVDSVMGTIVEPGAGYAVVNKAGNVLYHSDRTLNLRQDFLAETDENEHLRSLLQNGMAGLFNGQYWGIDHAFYVRPLEGTPWSVITFRNKDVLRTINFEGLLATGILYGLITGLALVFVLLIMIVRKAIVGGDGRWLWPNRNLRGQYNTIALVHAGIAAGGIIFLATMPPAQGGIVVMCLALPLAGILAIKLILMPKTAGMPGETPEAEGLAFPASNYRTARTVMVSSVLLLCSAFPAFGTFLAAHSSERDILLKYSLYRVWRALDHADGTRSRMLKDAAGARVGEIGSRAVPGLYVDYPVAITIGVDDGGSGGSKRLSRTPGYFEMFQRHVRIPYNETATETWALVTDDMSGKHLQFSHDGDGMTLRRVSRGSEGPDITLSAAMPYLPLGWSTLPLYAVWGGGVIVFLGLLYVLPRYILDRLFLMSWSPPRGMKLREAKDLILNRNTLVIGIPGAGKSRIQGVMRDMGKSVIDLHNVTWSDAEKDETVEVLINATADHVLVDHFEEHSQSPGYNRFKMRLVRKLLENRKNVCLISNIDPFDAPEALRMEDGEGGRADSHRNDQQQWTNVLASFKRVVFWDPLTDDAFDAYVAAKLKEEKHAVPYRLLYEESKVTRPLQDNARTIGEQEGFENSQPAEVYEKVGSLAETHYRNIWSSLTEKEHRTLYYLAADRFVYYKNPDLARLAEKGVIKRDHELSLFNESFRLFVQRVGGHEQTKYDAIKDQSGMWEMIQVPLVVGILALGLAIIYTQQEFQAFTATALSLLGALWPYLPKVVGAVEKGRQLEGGG